MQVNVSGTEVFLYTFTCIAFILMLGFFLKRESNKEDE